MDINPKEIRKQILEISYQYRSEDMVSLEDLRSDLIDVGIKLDDKTLHGEIIYLEDKGCLEVMGKCCCGKSYLYFHALKITSYGIDLVEDPEEFAKLFTVKINHIENISNSNIAINSSHNNQNIRIKKEDVTPEIKELLKKIKVSIEKEESSAVINSMDKLKKASKNIFYGVVANGIFQFLSTLPK